MAASEEVTPRRGTSAGIKAAFGASPVPTAITRASDGVIIFANVASLQLLGWPATEFVGRTMAEVGFWTHPETPRGDARGARRAKASSTTSSRRSRPTAASGGSCSVSISHVELDGEPCLIGHIHDITERRLLEEARERDRENIPPGRQENDCQQGFLLREVDPPAVLYASPAMARIFGVDLDDVYRDPLLLEGLLHPRDREKVAAGRGEMTEATDFEYRIVRPDGETRWVRTRAEPVRMQDGRVTRIGRQRGHDGGAQLLVALVRARALRLLASTRPTSSAVSRATGASSTSRRRASRSTATSPTTWSGVWLGVHPSRRHRGHHRGLLVGLGGQ